MSVLQTAADQSKRCFNVCQIFYWQKEVSERELQPEYTVMSALRTIVNSRVSATSHGALSNAMPM